MTAINVIRRKASILLITDGASVDQEGVLQHVGMKTLLLPFHRAALAFRGPAEFMAVVALNLTAAAVANFEELVEGLPGSVMEAMGALSTVRGPCEVILAGISFQRQRTETYLMSTVDTSMPDPTTGSRKDVSAFELVEAGAMVAAPVPSPEMMAEFGLGASIDPEEFNPYVHGISLLQAQRRTPHTVRGEPFIGGMININTITAHGINSEIAHTWPDKLGEKIVPAG